MVCVIEPIPHLDLHYDVTLAGPSEQVSETIPILIVPLVQVVLAVRQSFEWIDLEALVFPVTHGIANIVPAHTRQQIQVLLQVWNLKEVVVL